jgi:hypothetical protein
MKNEIIIYQADSLSECIEVTLENETVWLSQQQMALLFNQSKQNISLHINNCFKEKELDRNSTVKDYLIVQMEANREVKRRIEFYSLDVIISVGYRVKSIKGTQFRIWANRILTEYLLKGYAINNRMNRFENQLEGLTNQVNQIEVQIKTKDLPVQGIFMDKTWGPFPLLFYHTLRYLPPSLSFRWKLRVHNVAKTPHYFFGCFEYLNTSKKVAKNLRDGFYTLRFTPKA